MTLAYYNEQLYNEEALAVIASNSEAIQKQTISGLCLDCFVASASRNDDVRKLKL